MPVDIKKLNILKQALLVVSILYFYVLAFMLRSNRQTYGLDQPLPFVSMALVFLTAISIEAGFTWWHRRKRIGWWALLIFSYALLGLVIAPSLYGDSVLLFALLLPLITVFVGGFAFAFSNVLYRAFRRPTRIPLADLKLALQPMPGWDALAGGIEKLYRFPTLDDALRFVNVCGVLSEKFRHPLHCDLQETRVKVRLQTPDAGGVTEKDLLVAREFDRAL